MDDTGTTGPTEALQAGAAPVRFTGRARGRANLRPPWKPGQSGNPKGRPSHRRLFEEALARAVTERAEEIVEALVSRAIAGDVGMMRALLDRLVPRIDRHELETANAPSRIVLTFEKPEANPSP